MLPTQTTDCSFFPLVYFLLIAPKGKYKDFSTETGTICNLSTEQF